MDSSVLRLVNGSPFKTIQGEGLRSGMPSAFLRLAGCDLRCHVEGGKFWNCDTPDSLPDYKHKLKVFEDRPTKHAYEMPIDQVSKSILKLGHVSDLVITGGEPMFQSPQLAYMMQLVCKTHRAYTVTIETNCRKFDAQLAQYVNLPSLSPKIQSILSQGGWAASLESRILSEWSEYTRKYMENPQRVVQLKIVCATLEEYEVAKDIFLAVYELPGAFEFYMQVADSPHTDRQGLIKAVLTDNGLCRLGIQAHKLIGVP
jgi:7-carboxy-7-deazaguanine synthase